MENSLDSSPESTVPDAKAVFKKPKDFSQAFQVSMEESYVAPQNNKLDIGLELTPRTNKPLPFRKSRKSVQHSFNVSSGDSLVSSECEQSVNFTQPQGLFDKKDTSLADFFNVSFDETTQADALGKGIDCDESVTTHKANPFAKNINDSENDVTIRNETSALASEQNESDVSKELQVPPPDHHDSFNAGEADSTTFVTKQNPFKKSKKPENESISEIQLSVTDENKSNDEPESNLEATAGNIEINSTQELSVTKPSPFEQNESSQKEDSETSLTKQRSCSIQESNITHDMSSNSKAMNVDKNISKMTSNPSYLEQSSINDENLNNWMSDQSDDEMPQPTVPTLTANLSNTKEQPAISSSPPAETHPMSVWEQKLSEIVSNAEKRSNALKMRTTSVSPKKKVPFKKPKLNNENTGLSNENVENKYKPPKLLKPASFATKQLYGHIIKKLEPKYGIDTMLESENLVSLICDTVKKVTRRKTHQKKLIQNLKKEMAEAGLIETTVDFHEFIIKFLPYSFRVKVVPCLQPVTNMVYPPKDVANPFDKVL